MLLPPKLLGLIYVAIGVFVASSKDYLDNPDTVKRLLSALLAILLWAAPAAGDRPARHLAK